MFGVTPLVPAYGRDYKSKKAAQADFDAGKDFTCVNGQATTKVELKKHGYTAKTIEVRNADLTRLFMLNM